MFNQAPLAARSAVMPQPFVDRLDFRCQQPRRDADSFRAASSSSSPQSPSRSSPSAAAESGVLQLSHQGLPPANFSPSHARAPLFAATPSPSRGARRKRAKRGARPSAAAALAPQLPALPQEDTTLIFNGSMGWCRSSFSPSKATSLDAALPIALYGGRSYAHKLAPRSSHAPAQVVEQTFGARPGEQTTSRPPRAEYANDQGWWRSVGERAAAAMASSVRAAQRASPPPRDEHAYADSTPPPQPALANALRPIARPAERTDDFRIYRGSNYLPNISTGRVK